MKRLILCIIYCGCFIGILGCDLWIMGSEKSGYKIIIESAEVNYHVLKKIENTLLNNGFKISTYIRDNGNLIDWKEIDVGYPRYSGEVYTVFQKDLSKKKYHWVIAQLSYVKNINMNKVEHLYVKIENWFIGGQNYQIKNEINLIGEIIYIELKENVGENNVSFKKFGKVE